MCVNAAFFFKQHLRIAGCVHRKADLSSNALKIAGEGRQLLELGVAIVLWGLRQTLDQ